MKIKWVRITVLLALLLMLVSLAPEAVGADGPFCVPTTGTVTQRFHSGHEGVDIASGTGPDVTPVYAAYAGQVVYRGTMNVSYPLDVAVAINHGIVSGKYVLTCYHHMGHGSTSYVMVNVGDWVEQGELIGYQGDYPEPRTGGVHLHFSVAEMDEPFLNEYTSWGVSCSRSDLWYELGGRGNCPSPYPDPAIAVNPESETYLGSLPGYVTETCSDNVDTNTPPTADAGGPYAANEGDMVILDASGSSDSDGTIVSFEWDLDGDGEYDDATGQTPSWTWGDDYAGSIGLKVTDDDGATDTDTTTVTISNVAPTVDAGPDQTVFRNDVVALSGAWTDPAGSLDEPYFWTWDVTGDGIMDNSGSASYGSVAPASTSFAMEGIYTLTFSVMDKDGGAGSDSIMVEVLNRPPDCSVAAPSIETIWPPNHKLVLVNVLGVTDPEGDPISITIKRIRQDEPVDTVGKGRLSPDGRGVGTDTAHVQAERMGTKKAPGNGRVYHIGFTADDGHGGSCSSEVLVGVPHDRRGTPPVDDGALYDSTALAP